MSFSTIVVRMIIVMMSSYPQVVLSAMESSCLPPEPAPAQSRTDPEISQTSRIETVTRAKEVASSWSKEATKNVILLL